MGEVILAHTQKVLEAKLTQISQMDELKSNFLPRTLPPRSITHWNSHLFKEITSKILSLLLIAVNSLNTDIWTLCHEHCRDLLAVGSPLEQTPPIPVMPMVPLGGMLGMQCKTAPPAVQDHPALPVLCTTKITLGMID